jgi:hypothetical protein
MGVALMPAVNQETYTRAPQPITPHIPCPSCGADTSQDGAIYIWNHGTPASNLHFYGHLFMVYIYEWDLIARKNIRIGEMLYPTFRNWRMNKARPHFNLYCTQCDGELNTMRYEINQKERDRIKDIEKKAKTTQTPPPTIPMTMPPPRVNYNHNTYPF